MIHQNSYTSYHMGERHLFGARQQAILTALETLGTATDRQLMEHLELSDPNAVRPWLTELIRSEVVEECGARWDDATGPTVRVVRIRPWSGPAQLSLFAEVVS